MKFVVRPDELPSISRRISMYRATDRQLRTFDPDLPSGRFNTPYEIEHHEILAVGMSHANGTQYHFRMAISPGDDGTLNVHLGSMRHHFDPFGKHELTVLDRLRRELERARYDAQDERARLVELRKKVEKALPDLTAGSAVRRKKARRALRSIP